MGISSSLYIAMSGMSLSQAAMEVASHNIANVNTAGYSRQRINLETTPTWKSGGWGQMGTGVTAQNIARYHDEFLTRSIINKSAEYAREAARKSAIDSLEAFFNESDGNGINAAMNDFFALWDSVADAAEIDPTREELVSVAQTLAAQIAARRQDMDAIRQDLNSRVEAALQDVNLITEEIAALNQQIMAAEDPSRNQQANDLRDVRDALMTQLSELMSIEWWEDPTSGAVNITVPGGPPLVMNTGSYPLSGRVDSSGDIRVIANNRPGEPKWEEDVTERISGGAIGGWVDFRDQTMREFYLEYETFADQLIFQINNQHAQGVGQDLYAQSNSSSLISNLPSQLFSFTGLNNDLRLTALTPHLDSREPYSAKSDPENIAVRFVKSEKVANEVTSTVVWNDKDPGGGKWEITVVLPTDSNGNITATAEDVIRHINSERSPSPASGAPVLPPASVSGTYKIGDFISAESGFGENWGGLITFPGPSYPSGSNTYTSLDRSLANTAQQGHHLSYGSEYAEMTTSLKHTNNDVTFIAKDKGAAGEKIAVEYTAPAGANQPLSVTVLNRIDGSRIISVSLATDASGNVTTTANDIVELINNDAAARDLVEARRPEGTTGEEIVKELDTTYLDRSGFFEIVTYDENEEPSIYRITVDPTDTLEDVVDRIGSSFGQGIKGLMAEVVTDLNGKSSLRIVSDGENAVAYGFRNDTSGALAVLGLNNLFTGDSSANVAVNQAIVDNHNLLAAARIPADGRKPGPGNNDNALDMADLKEKRFSYYNLSSATLGTAFNTFYGDIGSTNRGITTQHDFLNGILGEMTNKQDSLAGVNLDEELADILRYQYMYQASAKMVSTIDSLMETLLAIR